MAQLWFSVDKEASISAGVPELCGINHAYMPIVVKPSIESGLGWLTSGRAEFAADASDYLPAQPLKLAAAE